MSIAEYSFAMTTKRKLRKIFSKASVFAFLVIILIFPSSSFQGAKKGLLLWFNTLLPTLLPFMILSNLIIRMQITKPLSKLLYPIFHRVFKVSLGGCYPVLMGFLTGIPVGAKTIADMIENKSITTKEGQYLLGFCNNVSPMFVMSYIALSQLNRPDIRIALFVVIYISGFFTSYFWFLLNKNKNITLKLQELDTTADNTDDSYKFDFAKFDAAIMEGFDVITRVGGYIILFSIAAQIISDIGSTENIIKLVMLGFLEITTGINKISTSDLPMNFKIAFITMITAFGGFSGIAQTNSVISNTRLSIGTYIKVKTFHMMLALVFIMIYLYLLL